MNDFPSTKENSFISSVLPPPPPCTLLTYQYQIRDQSRLYITNLPPMEGKKIRDGNLTKSDDAEVPEISNLPSETSDNENTLWNDTQSTVSGEPSLTFQSYFLGREEGHQL